MKAVRITLGVSAALLLTVLVMVGALWVWAGSSTSLASVVNQVSGYLPSGQTLEAKDVRGNLRAGGSIGWLRWQQGDLSVDAHELTLGWQLRPLFDGELSLGQLSAKHLRIDDRRKPAEPSTLTPPTDLRLPFKVNVPFSIDTIEWVGPPSLEVNGLTGSYVFDSREHRLDLRQVRISYGTYGVTARLQALSPMALSVHLDGVVQTPLPSSQKTLVTQAQAEVRGALAGRDAMLTLQGSLVPELNSAGNGTAQATVSARLLPWQRQSVDNAHARWRALDLSALWPQAPQTQLSGEARVTPEGPRWRAQVKVHNALAGPWDKKRLPLDDLNADVVYADGQWSIESLQASGARGHLAAEGRFADAAPADSKNADWQGKVTVRGVDTSALDSRLAGAVLDGELTARQTPTGIAFSASLQPAHGTKSGATGALAGLRIKTFDAQGQWRAPQVELQSIQLETDDAQFKGQMAFNTVTQATAGQLRVVLPGAQGDLAGDMASTTGQGNLSLKVNDAALALRWLRRLPGLSAALGGTSIQGGAEFTGHWQGGWQRQGQDLQIRASARAPRFDLLAADQPVEQSWRLRDLEADLSGTLRALSLATSAKAENATRRFALKAQAQGAQMGDGRWQARFGAAELSMQDTMRRGVWTLRLSEGVNADWRQNASSRTLQISAGSVRLGGPAPGAAALSWQPVHWSQQMMGDKVQTQWRTQGKLDGIPLAWLDLLGQTKIANLGLRGDMLFGGQWDAEGSDALKVRATLERTGGDLQLLAEDAQASNLHAGVRDARLMIAVDGEQLSAKLLWDSERAGRAQADLGLRLQRHKDAWALAAEAPLTGTVSATLPPVGAWSLLAPPGWRLRGTLDANAVLSGTLGAPQWKGSLKAQDLAVRSVVDGIDFSAGMLQARLEGDRLDIVEFTLRGAGGESGGLLTIKGSVLWLPATDAASTPISRLRMELDAQAQALRLSGRADRRLAMSGKVSARLANAHLSIGGKLSVDEALFILPDDAAPTLGEDVLVRTADSAKTKPDVNPSSTTVKLTSELAITLDLGRDFQVRGRGLQTRVAGTLELGNTAKHSLVPRLSGEVRTVRGSYKAYGQELDIDRGVLRFFGPYDNPALDILAIRPKLQQRVGVQISGTALSPVVRLYAEPDLPDAEKLAWLVLGHAGASGGAEAAILQQAALALLGGSGPGLSGNLMAALGLDELSVSGGTSQADGTTTGATVTLGKRLSRDFYVSYERSLAGTMGTFNIFYDLSRRFTLRAQTGEQSAVDLILTLRYD